MALGLDSPATLTDEVSPPRIKKRSSHSWRNSAGTEGEGQMLEKRTRWEESLFLV